MKRKTPKRKTKLAESTNRPVATRRGRPTKYRPEYCEELIAFFDRPPTIIENGKEKANEFPMFIDFAMKIGVCMDTLKEWRKVHRPEFSSAYKKAKQLQERNWQVCSMKGLFSPAFTIFMGKNVFGWTDHRNHQIDLGKKTADLASKLAKALERTK